MQMAMKIMHALKTLKNADLFENHLFAWPTHRARSFVG